ncbi:hypothetical protein E2I00_004257, partial [Balaenoptera physalus]
AQVPKASGQEEQGCFSTFPPEGARRSAWRAAQRRQPLFRKCQALSDLSSNALLVSVMLMDSQMRGFTDVCVHQEALGRSCQGVAEEQTCHRLGLAGGWARTEVSAVRPEVSQTILSTNYSPPESVLTNRRDLRPADGSYQAPRDAWGWVPLLPPPSQAALARFTESFPDLVKCACKPSFGPGVLEITWQPLELGSLAPNLASDLAPEQVGYGTEHNFTPNRSERPGLASQPSDLLSPRGGGAGWAAVWSTLRPPSPPGPQWNPRVRNVQQSERTTHVHPGGLENLEPHLLDGNPEQLCPARPRVQLPSWEQAYSMMMSPYSLPYLLFLPLGACFPVLDTAEPVDAVGGIGGEMSWADLAGGRHFPWVAESATPTRPARHGQGAADVGQSLRLGRQQDDGSEATGFLLGDGEEAGGLLGTLAEELNSYSRKEGGFSFRFGRGEERAAGGKALGSGGLVSSDGSATLRLCGLGLGPASVRRGKKWVPGAACSSGSSAPPDVQHGPLPRSPGKRLHGTALFDVLWWAGSVSSDKAAGLISIIIRGCYSLPPTSTFQAASWR